MPAKKSTKVHRFHEGSGDDQLPVFSIWIEKDGQTQYGRIDVELLVNRAPKACEIFLQSCSSAVSGDKKGNKRVLVRQLRFVRLTNEGLQVGERPSSRSVPLAEIESEVGRVNHGLGVISLCRALTSFDESFFFCLTDDSAELDSLDRRHAAFGRVVDGLDTLLALRESLLPYVREGCILEGSPYTILEILPKTSM